jgi:hypothetical protein
MRAFHCCIKCVVYGKQVAPSFYEEEKGSGMVQTLMPILTTLMPLCVYAKQHMQAQYSIICCI